MESTFKKEYEVQHLANGAMELTFKNRRIGAHNQAAASLFLTLLIFVVGGFAAICLALLLSIMMDDENFWMHFFISCVVVFGGLFYILSKTLNPTSKIVVTKEGLIFPGPQSREMQIAFEDVIDWGVMLETSTAQGHAQTAFLYAQAGGQEFRMTKHLKPALAKGLHAEIQRYVKSLPSNQ
ncbi:MAG: hypothetical protein V4448_11985 [Pseudomonadota bacterium]